MSHKQEDKLEDIRREIVIERLRQAPPNVKISFGSQDGKFMNRDELIAQVENHTDIGDKIIRVQIEYLKAFKKGLI